MKKLDTFFKMKPDSIGNPDFYCGAKIRPLVLPNGVRAPASTYNPPCGMNVKDYLAKKYPGCAWSKRANAPLPSGYELNLDVTPELDAERSSFYHR